MGEGVQAAISNKAKMYLSQNYDKKAISSFVFCKPHLLMTSQNSIHHITDITYTSEIFHTYIFIPDLQTLLFRFRRKNSISVI